MHTVEISDGWYRRPGSPAIWVDGDVHEEANNWLNWDIMGGSSSPDTWKQAAHSLKFWLDWCRIMEVDWRVASRDCLIEWRDAQINSISPKTGEPYSPNTVRVRMSYVFQFLDFASAQGQYQGSIPVGRANRPSHRVIDEDPLAHTRKGETQVSRRNKLLPKAKSSDVVNVLNRSEIAALFRQAGERPSERIQSSLVWARDWLVIGIPLMTGLRKKELLDLTVHPFNAIVVDPEKPHVSYDIKVTGKGNKDRAVAFPGWLVLDIQAYINGERKRALKKNRRRDSQLLLVLETHAKAGHPLKMGGVNDVVERSMVEAGLVREKPATDPETGERAIRIIPRYSTHSLRHTYAVCAYHAHRDAGEPDPWKLIQMQLGHASPLTTMNIYLKYVHLFNERRLDTNLLSLLNA